MVTANYSQTTQKRARMGNTIVLILIILATTTLYITRWLSTEVTSVLSITALALTGILTPEQAIAGFSSTATVTVAAMFVLSAGLMRTGALDGLTRLLVTVSKGSSFRLLLALGVILPPISAFMNNTPIVVMMIPVVLSLSRQIREQPSKLLLPVSYFAILGGTMTLLGTSTNILVDDLYRKAGGSGLNLFTFAPLGLLYAGIGTLYIVTIGRRLLPNRKTMRDLNPRQDPIYVTEVVLEPGCALLGRPAQQVFQGIEQGVASSTTLRQPFRQHRRVGQRPDLGPGANGLNDTAKKADQANRIELLELFRGQQIFRAEDALDMVLEVDDALLLAGSPATITRFLAETRTSLATAIVDNERRSLPDINQAMDEKVMEAVLVPTSPFANRPLGQLKLHGLYGVKVLGVQRLGRQYRTGLRHMNLASGDVLLLQGSLDGLQGVAELGQLILIDSVEHGRIRSHRSGVALAIMAGVVVLATVTATPIVVLALSGAALMIVSGCLGVDEGLKSLDTATLMLLAGTIPLGHAMQVTGLAQSIVDGVLNLAGGANPVVFLSLFYLLTSVLTEILSNNAVAVLMTPIALGLAASLGLSPIPFLAAVAFGASASFMTPIGYQTNAMVMGPGGYTFTDYLRIGIPLQILLWITASIAIPLLWPLV